MCIAVKRLGVAIEVIIVFTYWATL